MEDYKTLISSDTSEGKIVRSYSQEDLSTLNKVNVKAVNVISGIAQAEQTQEQKRLYTEISAYVTEGLKKAIKEDTGLVLTEVSDAETLDIELAVSAVEVHLNDPAWNQFSRTALGINVVSYGVYLDEAVRILVESRISTGETLHAQSMHTIKDKTVYVKENVLRFEDVKPALDVWLTQAIEDLNKIRKASAK